MSSGDYAPIAVEIAVLDPGEDVFADLALPPDAAETEELAVSAPREVAPSSNLFFDVDAALHVVRSVTVVVTGVGGAARVVDWVLTKLRERRGKSFVLKVGSTSVTVRVGDDPAEARRLLKAALKAL